MELSDSAIQEMPTGVLATVRLGLEAHQESRAAPHHGGNQDTAAVLTTRDGGPLLLVCDGMGGMGRGEVASARAAALLAQSLARTTGGTASIEHALQHADAGVRRELCTGEGRHPGSTAAVAQVSEGILYAGWVGDTRIYHIRGGEVLARSVDHRVLEASIQSGAMTRDEARGSPMARFLSRSLGAREADAPAVEAGLLPPRVLLPGDWVVLCSDGFWDFLGEEEWLGLLDRRRPLEAVSSALLEAAVRAGSDDDVTVVVARVVAPRTDDGLVGDFWDPRDTPSLPDPDFEGDLVAARDAPIRSSNRTTWLTAAFVAGALAFAALAGAAAFVAGLMLA